MRELRFRFWSKTLKKFITHDVFGLDNPILVVSLDGRAMSNDEGYGYYWHPECIIQQYTGLKDKNGRMIYEGDILRVATWDSKHKNLLVEWQLWGAFNLAGSTEYGEREIIGNIFENPELCIS